MNNLKIFKNEEFGEVRTVLIGEEPYFVGKDVAEILDYQNINRDITRHVDEDERIMIDGETQYRFGIELGQRGGWLINESGLYSLIMSSKMPNAKKFKKWVTSEVLPSIRKYGMYATDELLNNPDFMIATFKALKEERNRVKELNQTIDTQNQQIAVQQQQITEFLPKVGYYDAVLNCKNLVAISTIAKDYGWSAKKLNKYLHEKGVQFKQGDIWLLYQEYAENGYTSTKTHSYINDDGPQTKVHTYWTQKGRLFIYELLKNDGVLPLIERK